MHDLARTHDAPAEGLADALVPEADAENRNAPGEAPDHLERDAGLVRRARPGRDHDLRGRERLDGVERDLVVAHDVHPGAQLAEVLHEVVGEGIVVVDHQYHGVRHPSDCMPRRAQSRAMPCRTGGRPQFSKRAAPWACEVLAIGRERDLHDCPLWVGNVGRHSCRHLPSGMLPSPFMMTHRIPADCGSRHEWRPTFIMRALARSAATPRRAVCPLSPGILRCAPYSSAWSFAS